MYDVIVVGGGPVGSYLAYKLAGLGYQTVVLERRGRIGEKNCCTGIIGWESTGYIPGDDVILRRVNSARLFSPSGKFIRLWRKETQALIVDRRAFDRAMAAQAQSRGVTYELGSLAHDLRSESQGVVVEIAHQGKTFVGKVAVIASGFSPGLTEQLGLGSLRDSVAGVQAEVESPIDEIEVYFGQEVAPGFFAWLVPTSPRRARVGLLARRQPGLYLQSLLSSLKAQGKIASADVKLDYGVIPLKPLPRTYADRMIVIGDAAGQVKPTTGGGIYYGLLCADIAVSILHQALPGNRLGASYLAEYERQWKRKLSRELAIGYQARKLYECLTDSQIERMFDIIKSRGLDQLLAEAEDLSFDWHGKALLRLLGHQAVSQAVAMMKLPSSLRRGFFRPGEVNYR